MPFTHLLGLHLKSDEVLELLEMYDVEVIYDFDRTHENMPDRYWAGSKEQGFLLRFSEDQVLDTVFLYMAPREGYSAVNRVEVDVPIYESFDLALMAFQAGNIRFTHSGKVAGARERWWIKCTTEFGTAHYQYGGDGQVVAITLSSSVLANDA